MKINKAGTAKRAAEAASAQESGRAKKNAAPLLIYHNARCSKSRGVCELLKKKKIRTEVIEYLKTPLTQKEIKGLLKKLGMKAEALVRKNEPVFREKYEGRRMTEAQWIRAMADDPVLIERPVVVKGDKAVIGRPEERVLELISAED